MNKLRIYILVDNTSSSTCKAEHGLSYVVEFETKILFDTGQSDLFIENAKQMQLDLNDIKHVVLSHGHYDHGNGLSNIENKKLICHPDAFIKRFSGKQRKPVGLALSESDLSKKFQLIKSEKPYWISDNICFLGQIAKTHSFEKTETSFYLENNDADKLLDDSAIAIKMKQGLFIISGCAHSGICNIIEHAKNVCKTNNVYGVMGGFHLKHNNKQTQQTIQYFKQQNIQVVLPSHCTELPALAAFYNEFGGEQIKAGNLYTFIDE